MIELSAAGYATLLGVSLLCWYLLRRSAQLRREPGAGSTGASVPRSSRQDEVENMRADLEELMVQLQELSRRVGSELDARLARIEAATRLADERISALQRLTGKGRAQSEIDLLIRDEPEPATVEADPERTDPRRQRIYRLWDAGHSAVQIAQQTGESPGEIELMLALRGNLGSAAH